jgi:hypothetical protein
MDDGDVEMWNERIGLNFQNVYYWNGSLVKEQAHLN